MTKFNRALFAILAVLLAMTLSLSVLADDSSVADESATDASSEVSADESADVSIDESAEESNDESIDESNDDSQAESKEVSTDVSDVSSANSTAAGENNNNNSNSSSAGNKKNFPWARVITLIVIVVLIVAAVILSKTNTKLGLKLNKLFKEYWSEMRKVSWSSPKDTLKATGVVLVFLVVAAAAIGILDLGFTVIIKKIAEIFN